MNWKKAIRTNQSRSNSFTDRLGWPHDFLCPKPPKPWVATSDGICLSLLAGWYVFILHTQLPSAHAGICIGVIQPVMIGLLIRLGNFASVHRPPISVLGRVSTGQWIIPSYDVIFVGPLLSMIVLLATQLGSAGLEMMNGPLNNRLNPRLDWCITVLSSCGVTIAMLLAFLMGPGLERWRLAASHRIVFDVTNRDSHAPFAEL